MTFLSGGFLLLVGGLLIIYYALPKRLRYLSLLGGSVAFYALCGPKFLTFLAITVLSVYGTARLLGRNLAAQKAYTALHKKDLPKEALTAYKQRQNRKRTALFLLCLLLNLGLLGALKYTSFLLEAFHAPWQVDWVLPLGISFYTFQSIGYLIDVKRGKYPPETNLLKYALFASFFPQMIQGPISRYDMLSKTLYEGAAFDSDRLGRGLVRMLWGYGKKLILADRLAPALSLLFGAQAADYRGGWVLLGMVLYALRLYADFTGGIDIALGVGELFGVTMPENFDRPYLSRNIEEYWTRWHMTMGSWFRDYLFYPLNVSKTFLRWTKALRGRFGNGFLSRLPLYAATLIVWLATGVWHGAGWNFALWGLTNGVVIILSLTLKPLYDRFHGRFPGLKEKKGYGCFEILRTFLLMCLIRLWDCYAGPAGVWGAFSSLFTTWNYGQVAAQLSTLGLSGAAWAILLVGAALLLFVSLKKGEGSFRRFLDSPWKLWLTAAGLLLLCLLLGAYGPGYTASDFIYGRF
jgi:D-alanyl-lipoteichoic acid acyltransferase DltB (MBOAT superfamily)